MAVDFEDDDSQNSKKKRKRRELPSKGKLLVDEKVEVRSEEEGFLGSWHPGTVIAYDTQVRHVKYDNIIRDDRDECLVEVVVVTPTIDGMEAANYEVQCDYRGIIRPFPPQIEFGKYCLHYGLCVDAWYNEAWWEGVILDHEDGSDKRSVFFPDLGDELEIGIDMLRITQDWNEVTEIWEHRGNWLLLELIEEYEQEHPLPLSVKQIWDVLQEKEDFRKVKEWTFFKKPLWKKLVVEAIIDILSPTVNELSKTLNFYNDLVPETELLLELPEPDPDVSLRLEVNLSNECATVPAEEKQVQNGGLGTGSLKTYSSSTSIMPIEEELDLERLMSGRDDDGAGMNHMTDTNVSCSDKIIKVQHQDLSVMPYTPAQISSRNGKPKSSYWLPAGPDLVPGAEYCPDAVTDYALGTVGNKRAGDIRAKNLRKHLAYLGWKIDFSRSKKMTRFRYTSPDEVQYLSLVKVCEKMRELDTVISSISHDDHRIFPASPNDPSSSPVLEQSQFREKATPNKLSSPSTYDSDSVVFEPEYCPEAVFEWIVLAEGKKKGLNNRQTSSKAKKHLSGLGWVFRYAHKQGRRELRYTSPRGKSYYTLLASCQACVEEGGVFEYKANTCTPIKHIYVSEEVDGHLESNKLSSAIINIEFEGSLVGQNLPAQKQLTVSQSNEVDVLGQFKSGGIRESQRSGENDMFHLASPTLQNQELVESQARLNGLANGSNRDKKWRRTMVQNTSLPKSKKGDDIGGSCPSRILRSSKRARQVAAPDCIEFEGSLVGQNLPAQKQLTVSQSNEVDVLGQFKSGGIRESQRSGENDMFHPASPTLQNQEELVESQARLNGLANGSNRDKKRRRTMVQNTSLPKSKKGDDIGGSCPSRILRSSKRARQVAAPNCSTHNPRTVLSWLIDNNLVLPRAKVQYRNRKDCPIAEGRITRDGIRCGCCQKVFTLRAFQTHASSSYHAGSTYHLPAANIFLEDGRSLLECQMRLTENNMRGLKTEVNDRPRSHQQHPNNDYICSVCHYGGELILCDQCPSSFHHKCLGLKDVPEGDWFCPSCCCAICDQHNFNENTEHLMDDNIHNCDQCERQYHVGCLRKRGMLKLESYPKGNWFCGKKCQKIFFGLQKLVGKQVPLGVDNLTLTLLKPTRYNSGDPDKLDIEGLTESYSKLNVALGVMHECFEPVKEARTRRDLVEDVIFSRRADLNRLNFRGFYSALLEKNDELISVATVRVFGEKVAEVPLVATRFQYRRLGMCRILMNELEMKLKELGVERLVLPAVPSVLNTWTTSFGFSKMIESERLEFLRYTFLDFQDTVMCQKLLRKNPSAEASLSRGMAGALYLPLTHYAGDQHKSGYEVNGAGDICQFIGSAPIRIDLDGHSPVSEVYQAEQTSEVYQAEQTSEVFQAEQIEQSEIVDQGYADTSVGNCSLASSIGSSSMVAVVSEPIPLECKPWDDGTCLEYLNADTNHKEEDVSNANATLKVYKRRRVLTHADHKEEDVSNVNATFKVYKRRRLLTRGSRILSHMT